MEREPGKSDAKVERKNPCKFYYKPSFCYVINHRVGAVRRGPADRYFLDE